MMNIFKKLVLAFGLSMPLLAAANNTYPVVLVHGYLGFNQAPGFSYWGGAGDIAAYLSANNSRKVFAVKVEPIASSKVRAAALLKEIESNYPEWDGNHPVHLVGHSQGGQTSRMLVQILSERGQAARVKSITTISTPHNGTPLAKVLPFEVLVPTELDPVGAAALNKLTPPVKDVYYFSVSNESVRSGLAADTLERLLGTSKVLPASDLVVPTLSMRAPDGHPVETYSGKATPGKWLDLGTFEGFNHLQIIGWELTPSRCYKVYDRIAGAIYSL